MQLTQIYKPCSFLKYEKKLRSVKIINIYLHSILIKISNLVEIIQKKKQIFDLIHNSEWWGREGDNNESKCLYFLKKI